MTRYSIENIVKWSDVELNKILGQMFREQDELESAIRGVTLELMRRRAATTIAAIVTEFEDVDFDADDGAYERMRDAVLDAS